MEQIEKNKDVLSLARDQGEKLLLVNLNKTWSGKSKDPEHQRENDYKKTRKYWKVNPKRADNVKYVLGVYKGIVVTVCEPKGYDNKKWYLVPQTDPNYSTMEGRYMFDGNLLENSPYLGARTEKSTNYWVIKYINC